MHQSRLIPLYTGLFRSTVLRLTLLLMASLGLHTTHAATRIWSGGHASSANWNLRDNWGGVAVPANGDTLVFPSGAARIVNTNNNVGLLWPAQPRAISRQRGGIANQPQGGGVFD